MSNCIIVLVIIILESKCVTEEASCLVVQELQPEVAAPVMLVSDVLSRRWAATKPPDVKSIVEIVAIDTMTAIISVSLSIMTCRIPTCSDYRHYSLDGSAPDPLALQVTLFPDLTLFPDIIV